MENFHFTHQIIEELFHSVGLSNTSNNLVNFLIQYRHLQSHTSSGCRSFLQNCCLEFPTMSSHEDEVVLENLGQKRMSFDILDNQATFILGEKKHTWPRILLNHLSWLLLMHSKKLYSLTPLFSFLLLTPKTISKEDVKYVN